MGKRRIRSLTLAVVLVAGALVTGKPRRACAAEPASPLVEAKRRYEALDYESCLAQLARAEAANPPPAERATIALYEGLCSFELGQQATAEAHFEAALQLDPRAALPPYTSPKIVDSFKAIATRVRAEQDDAPRATAPPAAPSSSAAVTGSGVKGSGFPAPPLLSILLGGCAAVAGGTGIYLNADAHSLASDANNAHFESDAYTLGDRARTRMTGANIAFVVGAVAAVVAIVYWAVDAR